MRFAELRMGYPHPHNFRSVIGNQGLTSGLRLCLDAGDGLSYRSGQSWLDRSGNGYDFFLGLNGSAAGDDPTFNGTPNLHSSNEYFGYDGGDFFAYDSVNEAWMQNLHKAGAVYSMMGIGFVAPFSSLSLFATANLTSHIGVRYSFGISGHNMFVPNGVGGDALAGQVTNIGSTAGDNTWNVFGITVTQGGAGAGFVYKNGLQTTFSSAYVSPSAAGATFNAWIGASTNDGSTPLANVNGTRLACVAIWEGTTLSKAQMDLIYTAMRGRFGI